MRSTAGSFTFSFAPRGPVDLGSPGIVCVAQPEVDSHIVGGEIAAAAQNISTLTNPARREIDSCSNRIARALGSPNELQFDPLVVVRIHVAKQYRNAVHVVDDHVDLAVVENVAKRGTATNTDYRKPGPLDGGNHLKLSILQVVIEQRALGIAGSPLRMLIHLRIHMAIDNEQVLPTVIVVIEKSVGKA